MSKKVNAVMTVVFLTLFGSVGSNPEVPLRQISSYLDNSDDITETDWEDENEKDDKPEGTIGIRG